MSALKKESPLLTVVAFLVEGLGNVVVDLLVVRLRVVLDGLSLLGGLLLSEVVVSTATSSESGETDEESVASALLALVALVVVLLLLAGRSSGGLFGR